MNYGKEIHDETHACSKNGQYAPIAPLRRFA
jgi:hypothetical protein